MNPILKVAAAALLLLLAGCAQTYRFKVDALADASARQARTFAMDSGSMEFPATSLRFREAAAFVSRALVSKGLRPVEAAEADLLVTLDAAVSEPLSQTETWSEPVYLQSYGRSRLVRTPVLNEQGQVVRYVTSQVYTPPQTYFAGYQDINRNRVVYEKSLNLSARSAEGVEVWNVAVTAIDESSDLRAYIPLLAAAALPYIGESTEGAVVVSLKEDAVSVAFVRGRALE